MADSSWKIEFLNEVPQQYYAEADLWLVDDFEYYIDQYLKSKISKKKLLESCFNDVDLLLYDAIKDEYYEFVSKTLKNKIESIINNL